jgi:hypothetical protein
MTDYGAGCRFITKFKFHAKRVSEDELGQCWGVFCHQEWIGATYQQTGMNPCYMPKSAFVKTFFS